MESKMQIQPAVRLAVARFFRHVGQLDQLYHWPEPTVAIKVSGFEPDLYVSQARWHLKLRRCLTKRWKAAGSGAEGLTTRGEIARWVVADWGGVKRNADKTIKNYVLRASELDGNIPSKGIASFSKILAVAAPGAYAILDARVAAALNALQILDGVESGGIAFPSLPTRNETVKQFNRYFKSAMAQSQWQRLRGKSVYDTYLTLLRDGVSSPVGDLLQKREMLLFAMAERLCKKAIEEFPND